MTPASAQFLRLGPFDFSARTGLDAIFTTNVEGERPSEAEMSRRDFYLVWSLDLSSFSQVGPRTKLNLGAGYSRETHFERDDLDANLGYLDANFNSDWDPFLISGGSRLERDTEMDDDKYAPVGSNRQKRKLGTSLDNFLGLDWKSRYALAGIKYEFSQERYEDPDYFEDENDEITLTYYLELILAQYISIRYEMEKIQKDLINKPDGRTDEETETITINSDQLFGLLERPKVTYSIGVQREYEDGETDGWELIHLLSISDEWDISPTLRLDGLITYKYEQNPEEDDVALQFGITLTQILSERTTHSFAATRKPVETLGSTEETEETSYKYNLAIRDIFIQNLSFNGSIDYKISKPLNDETEKVLSYSAGLTHSTQISAKLSRSLSYVFTREDSNLEEEYLDEHRVTLSFQYRF